MSQESNLLNRTIIDSTHTPYPFHSYVLTSESNPIIHGSGNSSSFPVTEDVSQALEFTEAQIVNLPTYYRKHLNYVHFAADYHKFNQLPDYASQAAILGLSDSTTTSIVKCGKYDSGLCHKERLCPYCARNKATERWKEFEKLYPHARWSFLTISYEGHMTFSEYDHTRWVIHWDAGTSAIKRLQQGGYLTGAFIREELSLDSYIPQRVKPHVHAIISRQAADLDEKIETILRSFVEGYRDDDGNAIDLEPNISISPIDNISDFRNRLYYTQKAIDLVTPYRHFFYENLPPQIAALNRAARDFTESLLAGTYNKTQTHYVGDLHKNTNAYLGKTNNYITPTLHVM